MIPAFAKWITPLGALARRPTCELCWFASKVHPRCIRHAPLAKWPTCPKWAKWTCRSTREVACRMHLRCTLLVAPLSSHAGLLVSAPSGAIYLASARLIPVGGVRSPFSRLSSLCSPILSYIVCRILAYLTSSLSNYLSLLSSSFCYRFFTVPFQCLWLC